MQKKKVAVLLGVAIMFVWVIFMNYSKSGQEDDQMGQGISTEQETGQDIHGDTGQTDRRETRKGSVGTEPETEGFEGTEHETVLGKTEGPATQGLQFELSQLESFMDEAKIREVEERLMEIAPAGATKVTCMDYQDASQEEMNVTCYLQYDSGEVAELSFSFSQATFAVEMSSLTGEEVGRLQESEAQKIQESEEKARKKAQRRLDKERRAKESETETGLPGQPEA